MLLYEWAAQWGVPHAALADLQQRMGQFGTDPTPGRKTPGSEDAAQTDVQLEASRKGLRLFRNNVGVLKDKNGRPVRYGLANHTQRMNEVIKSGDLIGFRPVEITPAMVGTTIGQFVSREIKPPGWHYTGAGREKAQLAWCELVLSFGGDAAFATGEGSL